MGTIEENGSMDVGRFIAGIGALIWDPEADRYLLLRRSPVKDFAPGAWECVTGRVDQGEGFEDALHREVWEEIGAEVTPLSIVGTTHFYRGDTVPENELVGIVYLCRLTSDSNIEMSIEHDAYRWVSSAEAEGLLRTEVPTETWLQKVIRRADVFTRDLPRSLLEIAAEEGFELNSA